MYILIGTIIAIFCISILAIPIFSKKILEKELKSRFISSKTKIISNNKILKELKSDYEAGYISKDKFEELNSDIFDATNRKEVSEQLLHRKQSDKI